MGSTCSGCISSEQPLNIQNNPESSTSAVIKEEKEEIEPTISIESLSKAYLIPPKQQRKSLVKNKRLDHITEIHNGKIISQQKSPKEQQLLNNAINSLLILRNIDEPCKQKLIDSMKLYHLESKEIVFEQGRPSECFFIVSSGRLEVLKDENRISILKQGDCFGEQALFDDSPRRNTVRTVEKSFLWVIDRNNYRSVLEYQSALEFKETNDFITSVPIFKSLTDEQLQVLISVLTLQDYEKDQIIFNEGEPGDTLHIVKEGEVNVIINNNILRTMGKGSFYGDQALISRCARTATIKANTSVTVLVIKRDSLVEVFGSGIEDVIFKNIIKTSLEKTTMLKDTSNIQKIQDFIKIIHYSPGDYIIKKGTRKGQKLYIVVKGRLKCGNNYIEAYEIIGESEMKRNSKDKFLENIIADTQSVVAEISKKRLESFMDIKIKKLNIVQEILSILQKVSIFRYLPIERLKLLVKFFSEQAYEIGESIISQGEVGDKLYILKNGTVNIIKNNDIIRTLTTGSFFGERALIYNEPRSASVIASSQVICLILEKSSFKKIVDDKMNNALIKRVELQNDTIGLNDLIPIKILGKGTYGRVYLCADKEKKSLYALKSVTRQKIAAYELYENLNTERSILMKIDHLMIVKLVKTFKDNLRVYFLMEFVRGIDLFDLQSKLSIIPLENTRFYVSCIVIILDFLHKNDIIYRDLKPENMFVDEEGYLKLIDFGSAKVVKGKTYSNLGTPHYMAPEIMTGTGYTCSIDWWSLGIILYEMLEGFVPFGPNEEDPIIIYEKVVGHNLIFYNISDNETKSLIQQFLSIKPGVRNLGSIEKLKSHDFFNKINWESVLCRQTKPKFIPKINDLSQEVSRSFIARKNLMEMIGREEAQEILYRQNSKAAKTFNWDSNF
ncbi:hypothetical protein SteCoe_9022 [Stentor coeruleus]|uniref:cGMP-dependent protein kinase n=1 Tax=Stentor coeruleus TaxID=5963 RepID=A0A1R2CIT6_9CILI|nr:hypothetical protein SteCoe_9022 [Stentor coeruleus]